MDNKKLNWGEPDIDTKYWAEEITFKDFLRDDPETPSCQYNGNPEFSKFCLLPSPDNIKIFFQKEDYFQGMVLVIFWGSMWDKKSLKKIFTPKLSCIQQTLKEAKNSIIQEQSINNSWNLLEKNLGWSNVFISKVLHFLSRSAGFEKNPPVPIDNGVILNIVWPEFIKRVKHANDNHHKPKSWNSDCICGYLRYMTLINVWTKQKNWSTTDVEITLYQRFRKQ